MPTYIKKSIGTGKDYSTLSSFMTALLASEGGMNPNLVSTDTIIIAEIYGIIEDNVTISGLTTGTGNYLHIMPAPGWRHSGTPGSGATIKASTLTPPASAHIIKITSSYVWIDSLLIEHPRLSEGGGIFIKDPTSAVIVLLDRCLFVANAGVNKHEFGCFYASSIDADITAYIRNSVFYAKGIYSSYAAVSAVAPAAGSASVTIHIANSAVLGSNGYGFQVIRNADTADAATINAYNCIVADSALQAFNKSTGAADEVLGGDYNVGGGTPGANSPSFSLNELRFSSLTTGGEDARPLPSSPILRRGANPAASYDPPFPTGSRESFEDRDINHNLRNIKYSIGAYESREVLQHLSSDRWTDVPMALSKPSRYTDYDGPGSKNYLFNRQMRRIDTIVTNTTTATTAASGTASAYAETFNYNRQNLLCNSTFSSWTRGTSFTTSAAIYTADAWRKSQNAKVTKVTAPSSSFSSDALKLQSLQGGTTPNASVKQSVKIFWKETSTTTIPQTFSIGCDCTVASFTRLFIEDQRGTKTYSSYHSGFGEQRLIVQASVNSGDTIFHVGFELANITDLTQSATFYEGVLIDAWVSKLNHVPLDPVDEMEMRLSNVQKYDSWYIPSSGLRRNTSNVDSDVIQVLQFLPVPLGVGDNLTIMNTPVESLSTTSAQRFETDNRPGQPVLGRGLYNLTKLHYGGIGWGNTAIEMGVTPFPVGSTFNKDANTKAVNLLLEERPT